VCTEPSQDLLVKRNREGRPDIHDHDAAIPASEYSYPETPWTCQEQPFRALASTVISIYVAVTATDNHYTRARAAGAKIVRELVDSPYGSCDEYSARDIEGNLRSSGT
jgi:hypothetical protein